MRVFCFAIVRDSGTYRYVLEFVPVPLPAETQSLVHLTFERIEFAGRHSHLPVTDDLDGALVATIEDDVESRPGVAKGPFFANLQREANDAKAGP